MGSKPSVIKHYKLYPWMMSFNRAKSRCHSPSSKYLKYKIHFDMTKEEVKFLWFRDKAYLMKQPSIDRIDTMGNYHILNCRFIENKLNKSRPKRSRSVSGFKGVTYQADHKKFRCFATVNKKHEHLGYFDTAIEAAEEYDKHMIKIGETPMNRIGE